MKHRTAIHAEQAVCPDNMTIKFKMAGLSMDYTQDGVFQLDASMRPLDLSAVMNTLTDQGLSEALASEACDGMAEFIFARQLGEYFAANMKRVG